MTDDDSAVRRRLAELEAEVKAEAAATAARKQAALAKRSAAAAELSKRSRDQAVSEQQSADGEDIGAAIELAGRAARRANDVKRELQKRPAKGDKSWLASGLASLALGPAGWLYAGAWREAVPASIAWVVLASIASRFLPTLLTIPALMLVLPASAIAGVSYALQYNRQGRRTRLFGGDDKQKQLTERK